jgi:AcrR family transcriptional regulator
MGLARCGGPDAVVLREATRRVGVSPTAAYRHFATHDDLLDAVRREAQAALDASIEAEVAASPRTPAQCLEAYILGYLRFAHSEAGLFRMTMLRTGAGTDGSPAPSRFRHLLAALLDPAVPVSPDDRDHRAAIEVAAWAIVHGLALLLLDGPLAAAPRRHVDAVMDIVVQVVADRLLSIAPRPGGRAAGW